MIPTMILFGLVFGRWWRVSLLAAAVGWPALLVAGGVMDLDVQRLAAAAGLAVANTALGVLVHQGVLLAVRMCRRGPSSASFQCGCEMKYGRCPGGTFGDSTDGGSTDAPRMSPGVKPAGWTGMEVP